MNDILTHAYTHACSRAVSYYLLNKSKGVNVCLPSRIETALRLYLVDTRSPSQVACFHSMFKM